MKGIIAEHFLSVNGEVNPCDQGSLQYFVRFQGCNLNCSYCDTPKTKELKDTGIGIDEVCDSFRSYRPNIVNYTGGEPMLHVGPMKDLISEAFRQGAEYQIIKSNGLLSIKDLHESYRKEAVGIFASASPRVLFALDYKSLGEFHPENFACLLPEDTLNFPILDDQTYTEAVNMTIIYRSMGGRCKICFSPIHPHVDPKELMHWMVGGNPISVPKNLKVLLNLQLHKQANLR